MVEPGRPPCPNLLSARHTEHSLRRRPGITTQLDGRRRGEMVSHMRLLPSWLRSAARKSLAGIRQVGPSAAAPLPERLSWWEGKSSGRGAPRSSTSNRCYKVVATSASAGTFWSCRRQSGVASTSHAAPRARNRAQETCSNRATFWSGCAWRLDRRNFFWFDLNKHGVGRNAVLLRQRHPVLLSTSNSGGEVGKHDTNQGEWSDCLWNTAVAAV